jgi:hypothetical protein
MHHSVAQFQISTEKENQAFRKEMRNQLKSLHQHLGEAEAGNKL